MAVNALSRIIKNAQKPRIDTANTRDTVRDEAGGGVDAGGDEELGVSDNIFVVGVAVADRSCSCSCRLRVAVWMGGKMLELRIVRVAVAELRFQIWLQLHLHLKKNESIVGRFERRGRSTFKATS